MSEFGKFKGLKSTEKTEWEWFLEGEHEGLFVRFFVYSCYSAVHFSSIFIVFFMILTWAVIKLLHMIHPPLYDGVSLYFAAMICGFILFAWLGGVLSWQYPKLAARMDLREDHPTLSSKERKKISPTPYKYVNSLKRILAITAIPYFVALLYEYGIIP